jgi:YVTN family beta-propeller protein
MTKSTGYRQRRAAVRAMGSLLLLVACLAGACAGTPGQQAEGPRENAGVFLYLSCPEKPANDVRFQLAGLRFQAKDGKWRDVPLDRTVDGAQCAAGQIRLAEADLPPGNYARLEWRFSGAWVAGDRKMYSLALPGEDGTLEMAVDLVVPEDRRTAFFAEWEPDRSVIETYRFEPRFSVRGQRMVMADVQAYVACAGSDVVMVLDREQDTVAAVVGVGRGPLGVASDPVHRRVYVANSGSADISVIDAAAGRVISTVANSGCSPADIALSTDGRWLLAVNPDMDNVSVIDTQVLALVRQITVGRRPAGIVFDPGRGFFYVSSAEANTVSVLDPARSAPVRTVRVGLQPGGLAVFDSTLFVANTGSDSLSVVETPGFAVATTIPTPRAPRWVVPGPADRLCMTSAGSNEVALVYAPMRMVLKSLPGGAAPGRMAADLERRKLYLANEGSAEVTVLDLASGRVRAVLPVGRQPRGVALCGQ